jgi:hypothetical protein
MKRRGLDHHVSGRDLGGIPVNRQPCPNTINPQPREELMRAEEHLRCRMSGRVREFRLLVRDQGLVLQGHAHTYYAKQLVQHAVMETLNLPIKANEIEVS